MDCGPYGTIRSSGNLSEVDATTTSGSFLGDFVLCYLNDILIYSNTYEEHLEHISRVLEVLQEKKLYAKGTKCEFMWPSVTFLGFTVGRGSGEGCSQWPSCPRSYD